MEIRDISKENLLVAKKIFLSIIFCGTYRPGEEDVDYYKFSHNLSFPYIIDTDVSGRLLMFVNFTPYSEDAVCETMVIEDFFDTDTIKLYKILNRYYLSSDNKRLIREDIKKRFMRLE